MHPIWCFAVPLQPHELFPYTIHKLLCPGNEPLQATPYPVEARLNPVRNAGVTSDRKEDHEDHHDNDKPFYPV
jgi:hypothetical protein